MRKVVLAFGLMAVMSLVAWAEDVKVDRFYYHLDTDTRTATLTRVDTAAKAGGQLYEGYVAIPNTIACEGISYAVTAIGDSVFVKCRAITTLTIPSSVTSIGNSSVDDVQNVSYHGSAKIYPRALNGYVEGALVFSDSTKQELISCSLMHLKNVCVPVETKKIREFAFAGCNIDTLDIPCTIEEISDYAFSFLWCEVLFMASCTPPKVVHYTFEDIEEYDEPELGGISLVVLPNSSKVLKEYKKSKFWKRFYLYTYRDFLEQFGD